MAGFTQAQRDALSNAIATGARSMEYDGRRTTFRNQDEMLALLRVMDRQLGNTTGGRNLRPSSFHKGTTGGGTSRDPGFRPGNT